MSKFQIIIIAVFVVLGLVAVLIFAGILPGFKKGGSGGSAVQISMWGTFPANKFQSLLSDFNEINKDSFKIIYSEKKSSDYEKEIINALASGNSPDLWFLTQDLVLQYKDKIFPIPFTSYKQRDYLDSFINSADLFIDGQNIIGLPMAVDPLVLYWNRDLFASSGVSRPPQSWDEFLLDVQVLTKRDAAGNIIQSGAAMGEFQNVKNAKEILSMLILQAGNSIIDKDKMTVVLGIKGNNLLDPTESAVRFFNEFSNPGKESYSWNRALQDSDKMFTAGSLAMYFGYASELENVKAKNIHLNFDIAEVPQIKDSSLKATFGKIYGLVMSKNSKNIQTAFSALLKLTAADFEGSFSAAIGLGSSRRDVLAVNPSDPAFSVIYKSSIMSRAWLEPDPRQVSDIFKNMVESSATGKSKISEAVQDARKKLEELLK
jgi:multiple sugar transport system substrate-binding protein